MEFLETKVLLAALGGDYDELRRKLKLMLPGERESLRSACYKIIYCIDE